MEWWDWGKEEGAICAVVKACSYGTEIDRVLEASG